MALSNTYGLRFWSHGRLPCNTLTPWAQVEGGLPLDGVPAKSDIGQVTETDALPAAFAATAGPSSKNIALVAVTDAPQGPFSNGRALDIKVVTEASSALAPFSFSAGPMSYPFGLAEEPESNTLLGAGSSLVVAVEADAAFPIQALQGATLAIGLASETSWAAPMGRGTGFLRAEESYDVAILLNVAAPPHLSEKFSKDPFRRRHWRR